MSETLETNTLKELKLNDNVSTSDQVQTYVEGSLSSKADYSDLAYGYNTLQMVNNEVSAKNCAVNVIQGDITGTQLSVFIEPPANGKTNDIILRYKTGESPSICFSVIGESISRKYSVQGDTLEGNGEYQHMIVVMPTLNSSNANEYDIITTLKKISQES